MPATRKDLEDIEAAGWPLSQDTKDENLRVTEWVREANDRITAERKAGGKSDKPRRSTMRDPQGEDLMQIKVMEWAHHPDQLAVYPELKWLHHPPMGGGRSSAVEGAFMKRLGALKGVVDLSLPVPRGGYHGLYGELKYSKNGLTRDQSAFLEFVRSQGYYTGTWWDDWQLVANEIEDYLRGLKVRKS